MCFGGVCDVCKCVQELALAKRRDRRRSDGGTEVTGSIALTSGPLRETLSQASTTHTRSKSFGVFSTAQAVPGVPQQQPDSARNERSTAFTVRSCTPAACMLTVPLLCPLSTRAGTCRQVPCSPIVL